MITAWVYAACGAAARLEDERVHARDAAQDQVEPVHELEHALQRLVVLVGMQLGDLRPRRELGREPRVVLHRARAEQAHAHHPERLLREVEVVAQHLRLGQLRAAPAATYAACPSGTSASGSPTTDAMPGSASPKTTPRRPGRAHLHHERLVPDGRVVAPERHRDHLRHGSDEPVEVGLRVHLGDAVEGALPELGEVARQVLAAEDAAAARRPRLTSATVLPVPPKSTTNSLKKPSREDDPHAVDLRRAAGRRSGCGR